MEKYCVLCVLNQILRMAEYLKIGEKKVDEIFVKGLHKSAVSDFSSLSAPEFAEQIYAIFSEVTGKKDPYKRLRNEHNDMVLNNIDFFASKIQESADPLFTAAVYSLLGNIIDYGGVEIYDFSKLFDPIDNIKLTLNDYERFIKIFFKSKSVLFIADNAGEAVFDRLFMEQMKKQNQKCTIFYAVRSAPAINDILKDEAKYVGINLFGNIIESGSSFAGTRIARSTKEFKSVFDSADLIISKGQGNFETLESENQQDKILFVFKVKCEVVARSVGLDLGSLVFAFGDTIGRIKSCL